VRSSSSWRFSTRKFARPFGADQFPQLIERDLLVVVRAGDFLDESVVARGVAEVLPECVGHDLGAVGPEHRCEDVGPLDEFLRSAELHSSLVAAHVCTL